MSKKRAIPSWVAKLNDEFAFVRVGRRIFYPANLVRQWLNERTHELQPSVSFRQERQQIARPAASEAAGLSPLSHGLRKQPGLFPQALLRPFSR
jgi:hypothetical protein